MAQLALTTVGGALGANLGSGVFASAAAALGRAAGSMIGGRIDDALFGTPRAPDGPRMTGLHLQGSTEGASIPAIYGRVRLAGQMIWAARFKEQVNVEKISAGGGKGGLTKRSVKQTTYTYSLSFAVGLCEGKVARISRAWANGEPFDLSTVNYRLHTGEEDQDADPLIEAIEGASNAPAYRGLAYIVFENLLLERFGNVPPQLSFEIVRHTPSEGGRLEDMARGVCLIPGAGEFVYANEVIRRTLGAGEELPENMHAEANRPNIAVSLDQLASDLPNVESVMLVVTWFGTDLRCGVCQIKPGVEQADKATRPRNWRAGGVTRAGAHVVSQVEGGPAYGGTPADFSVVQAILALKARGYRVGLYPFVLMDVPEGNSLPNPYGGAAQPAYPWRGRITCTPAPGISGTVDKTSTAATQVSAFFGSAAAGDFASAGDEVTYTGPTEWSFRRFILHCAKLAQAAGGVDAFVLGSELRALTTIRSSASAFPAVTALKTLAADVRGIVGGATTLTYAADWSEYNGHQPQDGSGDVFFHLDPLWSDANIDCVGVDWYPPLTDWRGGAAHADFAVASSRYDPDYLEGRIEAGETFDFYYASNADRISQTRAPITDGAYGKPWTFRPKDLRAWWSNVHIDRPGGVESAATAWVPESKPIWLLELGCAAIDNGANAPNLFTDPKSAESAAPPFSSGAPDDVIQRRALEAYLRYWSGAANPVSAVYGAPMIETQSTHLWCWDARPFPYFPSRRDLWSDGPNWRLGHWLNGRAGAASLSEVVQDICRRAGVMDADAGALGGVVGGYVVDSPAAARDAIEPLMAVYDFDAAEEEGRIVFRHRGETPGLAAVLEDLVQGEGGRASVLRADGADAPVEARVRFIDPERDHALAMVSARQRDCAGRGVSTIDAPLSLTPDNADAVAQHALARASAETETLEIALPPSLLAVAAGDGVTLDETDFRVLAIEEGPVRRAGLTRQARLLDRAVAAPSSAAIPATRAPPAPAFALLDLPPLPGDEEDERPLAGAYSTPWLEAVDVYAGAALASASFRGRAEAAAMIGALEWDLYAGPVGRWDMGNYIQVRIAGALESVDDETLFAGANTFAVEGAGGWEIVQARDITLVGPGVYEFRSLLRGQLGTEGAMGNPTPAGARIVKLDNRLVRLATAAHEHGAPLFWAAAPAGLAPNDPAATAFTATWSRVWARPYAPVHLRGRRLSGGDVTLNWVRRTRIGGDDWAAADVPLAEAAEAYRVEIMDGPDVIRMIETATPSVIYTAAQQTADFGAPPSAFTVRVAQLSSTYGAGMRVESNIWL